MYQCSTILCNICSVVNILLFFFFKQKTAYEMRISDWSSDVCSSDLQQLPTHIMDGIGQVFGSVRDPLPESIGKMPLFDHIGAGESNYNRYDRSVTELSVKWLRDQENAKEDSPGVLFVGLVEPNFPCIVTQAYLDMDQTGRVAWRE